MQGTLEAGLARLCGGEVPTVGAGRTDAGVHALAQVAHADVDDQARLLLDLQRGRAALDALCGPQITIWSLRRVGEDFDARFSASARRYLYRLCDTPAAAPLWRYDTWHVGPPTLDERAMESGALQLVGEHDFSAFCRRRGDQHLIRRIDEIVVRRREPALVTVEVSGRAFCHQMVRSVVACLLRVGRGQRQPAWVGAVLSGRDRQAVGQIAPPHGLTLTGVAYDD